jgi:hypothetical protein
MKSLLATTAKRRIKPIAVAAALVASVAPALAAPPVPSDATISDYFCPNFADKVTLDVVGRAQPITFPDGRQIIASPNLRVTVTAPNGNSATYVIQGATHVRTLPNTNYEYTVTGRNLIVVPMVNGHPQGLFLTAGSVKFILDSNYQEVEVFSGPGTVLDVCKALA